MCGVWVLETLLMNLEAFVVGHQNATKGIKWSFGDKSPGSLATFMQSLQATCCVLGCTQYTASVSCSLWLQDKLGLQASFKWNTATEQNREWHVHVKTVQRPQSKVLQQLGHSSAMFCLGSLNRIFALRWGKVFSLSQSLYFSWKSLSSVTQLVRLESQLAASLVEWLQFFVLRVWNWGSDGVQGPNEFIVL